MATETGPPEESATDGEVETEVVSIEPQSRKNGCWRVGCLVVIGGFLCLIVASGAFSLLEPPWRLATGWWSFLVRWREAGGVIVWADVVLAAGLLLFLSAGTHSFARWIARHRQFTAWKFNTTAKSVGAVLAFSLAGIALLGVAHQLFWISTSKSRMTESTWHDLHARTYAKLQFRGLGKAFDAHYQEHEEFPAGGTFLDDGTPMHSWSTRLLPFLSDETVALATEIALEAPWDSEVNRAAMKKPVSQLRAKLRSEKTADGYAVSHFAANANVFAPNQPSTKSDICDGLTNTVFLGEVRFRHKAWGDPTNTRDLNLGINQRADGFGSDTSGGAMFMFGDGSVMFLSEKTDPAVLKALATPAGGEVIDGRF